LTIARAPRAWHNATIASACARRVGASPDLRRIWIALAPPSSAAAHFARSETVSSVSDVTA